MKSFVSTAALALAVVFAAPVMADTTTTATTEPTTAAMTEAQCSDAWTKCAADTGCQKDLEAKGCKAPEAAK